MFLPSWSSKQVTNITKTSILIKISCLSISQFLKRIKATDKNRFLKDGKFQINCLYWKGQIFILACRWIVLLPSACVLWSVMWSSQRVLNCWIMILIYFRKQWDLICPANDINTAQCEQGCLCLMGRSLWDTWYCSNLHGCSFLEDEIHIQIHWGKMGIHLIKMLWYFTKTKRILGLVKFGIWFILLSCAVSLLSILKWRNLFGKVRLSFASLFLFHVSSGWNCLLWTSLNQTWFVFDERWKKRCKKFMYCT